MKENKFRLIKNNRIVGYETSLIQPNGIFQWQYRNNYIQKGTEIVGPSGWTGRFINHDKKDMYLGLKDRNGKEIYENDIVQTSLGRLIVRFENGIVTEGGQRIDGCTDVITVIGNTHENMEILSK